MKWFDGKSGCQSTIERGERERKKKRYSRKVAEWRMRQESGRIYTADMWLVAMSRGRSDDQKQKVTQKRKRAGAVR